MNDFYMHIPSNTINEGNTTSEFRTLLPKRIRLEGDWCVALVECQYPRTFYNLRNRLYVGRQKETEVAYFREPGEPMPTDILTDPRFGTFEMEEGYYKNANEICLMINKGFETIGKIEGWGKGDLSMFKADEEKNGRVQYVKSTVVNVVYLSETLAYMLGFLNQALEGSKHAEMPSDMRCGVDTMYVYCDVIEYQITGDSMQQLLRTVPVSGVFGETVVQEYTTPHYVRLLSKDFSTITFSIKDHVDRLIPFAYGTVILKLHFKNEGRIPARFY